MLISLQYLEGGSQVARISSVEARTRLRAALARVPVAMVMLGWNLPPRLVDACAEECARVGADLYLWQPLLTGDGQLRPRAAWRTIGVNGDPVAGHAGKLEFTFLCPNRPAAREDVLCHLGTVIESGQYRGVFLDRIRFPSPAAHPDRDLACFCEYCREEARRSGVDLAFVQEGVLRLLKTSDGRRKLACDLVSWSDPCQRGDPQDPLEQLLVLRQRTISSVVRAAVELLRARGLKVGLDCFSPTLARMVGQHLPSLAACSDWIKVMTYARAWAPASIPYELLALADWLLASDGEGEEAVMALLADAAGWPLPATRSEVRRGGLSAEILTTEVRRGLAAHARQLHAGIELVQIPRVAELNEGQIRSDLAAIRSGGADGVVLSWDLLHIPLDRLATATSP